MQSGIDTESESDKEVVDSTITSIKALYKSEVPKLEIPLAVQNVISRIEHAQLCRAREDINMQLADILLNVQRIINRYTVDENVHSGRKISLPEHKKWRINFLDKIVTYAKNSEIREKTLLHILVWLEEWNAILSEMTAIDIEEHHHWIAKMEFLPEMYKAIESNVKTLSRISVSLFEEKKRQKKKMTSRGTLWKSWKERVIKRPATAHALRPDQMISDEFATNTKVSEIQDMLQELINTAMFNKLENNAIKYISSTIVNLSKALNTLNDEVKVFILQSANMYINETSEKEKELSLKIIRDLSEQNEILQQKLQDAEEKYERFIRSQGIVEQQLPTALPTSTLKALPELSPQSSIAISKTDIEDSMENILAKEFENIIDEAQTQETKASGIQWDSAFSYTAPAEMTPDLIEQQYPLPEKKQKKSSEGITEDKVSLKKDDDQYQSQKKKEIKGSTMDETSGSHLSDDKGKQKETKLDHDLELQALEKNRKEMKSFSEAKPKSFAESKSRYVPTDYPSTDTKRQSGKSGTSSMWERLRKVKPEYSHDKSQISSENKEEPTTESMDKESKSEMSSQAEQFKLTELGYSSEKMKTKGKKRQISPRTTTSKEGKTEDIIVLAKKFKSPELVKSQSRVAKETSESTRVLESPDGKSEESNLEEFQKAIMAFLNEKIDNIGKPLDKKAVPKEELLLKTAEVEKLEIIKAKMEEYFQTVAETVAKILREYKDIKNAGQVGEKPMKRKKEVSFMPGLHFQKPISAKAEISTLLSSKSMDPLIDNLIQMILTEIEGERDAPVASTVGRDHKEKEKQRWDEYLQEGQEKVFGEGLKHHLQEQGSFWKKSHELISKKLEKEESWLQMKERKQRQQKQKWWQEEEAWKEQQKQTEQDDQQMQRKEKGYQKPKQQQLEAWNQEMEEQLVPLEEEEEEEQMRPVQKELRHPKLEINREKEEKQKPRRNIEDHGRQKQKKTKDQRKINEKSSDTLEKMFSQTSVTVSPKWKGIPKVASQLHQRKAFHGHLKTLENFADGKHPIPITPSPSTQSPSPGAFPISGQSPTKTLTLTPQQAQELEITITPQKTKELGITVAPEQAQALGISLTPEQAQEMSITDTLQKALGITVTAQQAQALGIPLTPEQAQAQGITLTPQQAQALGITLTPEQAQALRTTVTPQQAKAQGITLTPQQEQALGITFIPEQTQELGFTFTDKQAQAHGITLTPKQAQELGITLTYEQAQALGTTVIPQQSQSQGIMLTPEKAHELGFTFTEEQTLAQGITLTPEGVKAPGITVTPDQVQEMGITVTPQQAQTLEIMVTPEQSQAQGIILTSEQAQTQGITLTPEQTQAGGITLTSQQAQALGITLSPEQAQTQGITLTLEQAQALGITLTPQQAQEGGITLIPQQAQAITLTPQQAQALGITLTPEQAQAGGITLTPEKAQAQGISLTPEQAQALGITLTPQQAQAGGITLTPQQAQAQGITLTPEQAQAKGITLIPEQAQAGGITLTPQQAQAQAITLTPEQAQAKGITLTPEKAQAGGITLTPQQAQALGITLTPEQAQAQGIPLTSQRAQAQGITLTPEQAQALGISLTPEQTQAQWVTMTPEQTQAQGITLTPEKAQALGITLTPQQAQAGGITLTPQQAQAINLTPQQAQAQGITLTPEKAQAQGISLTPEQAQAQGITLTPEKAQAQGISLTPEQAQAQGITLIPEQAQAQGVTMTLEHTQARGIPLIPEQAQAQAITLTPQQAQALGIILTPQQAQAQKITLTPQQAQAQGISLTPQQAQARGITLTPQQAQAINLTPQQAQAQGITLTPEQAQVLGLTLTPQQAQAGGITLTPQQAQAQGITLTPEQAQAQGITLTPQQAQAWGITLTPQQTQAQGITVTPEQAEALGITLTPEQAQALGITLTPQQAQAGGITLIPQQAQAITLTPQQAQALGITLTPEQAQAGGITLTPEKAQAQGISLTPEQAQALGITLTPQQAQARGITLTPQQAQAINLTPQQAQAQGITLTPEQAQVLGLTLTPQQAQAQGITLTPEQAQAQGITLTPQQAQAWGITLTPQQTQAQGITVTPEQAEALGITLTPEQFKALLVTLSPEKCQGLGFIHTLEKVHAWESPLTASQAQKLGVPITPENAWVSAVTLTPEHTQALGAPLSLEQAQALGISLSPEHFWESDKSDKSHVLGFPLTLEQVQPLGAPFIPGQSYPMGVDDLKSRAPLINEQLLPLGVHPLLEHTLKVGIVPVTDKSVTPSAPHISKKLPTLDPSSLRSLQKLKASVLPRQSPASAAIAEKSSALEVSPIPLQISQSPLSQVPGKSLGVRIRSEPGKLLAPQTFPSSKQTLFPKGQSTSVEFVAPEVPLTPEKFPIAETLPTSGQPLTLETLLGPQQFFSSWGPRTPQLPLISEAPLASRQPLISGVPLTSAQIPDFLAPVSPRKPLVPGTSSIHGELLEPRPLTLSEQPQAFQPTATCEQSHYLQAPSPLGQHQASTLWIPPTPGHLPTLWTSPTPGKPLKDLSSSVSKKSKERLAIISSLKPNSAFVHPSATDFKVTQAPFTTKKFQISEVSDTLEEIPICHDPIAMEQFRTFQSYLTNYRTPVSQTPYIPTLMKPVTSLPSLTTKLPKTSQISSSEWDQKSKFSPIDKSWILTSVSGTKKPKMLVPPSTPQELKEQRYFVDVEAQRKNLILLNQATKVSGLPSQLHTTARNLIIETLHTDTVRLGYLFHKYIAYRLIQRARNNLIRRLQVIKNTGKGYETRNLYIMLSRIDEYQKKVMQVWTNKQKSLEQKRNQCLRKMIFLFSQLQQTYRLNLSQPIPCIINKKQIPASTKSVQQSFLELLIEEDRKSDTLKKFRQEDQMEAIWNADLSTSSYPVTEKTSIHSLWAQLGGYPDIPMLLQLDVQSTFRKSLGSIKSQFKKIPK